MRSAGLTSLTVLSALAAVAGYTGVAAPAAADEFLFFRSPSGNIHCVIATGAWVGARCDFREGTPSFTRPPPGCELDWGHAFEVGATGPGYPACVGDSVASPGAMVLDYGREIARGGIRCRSERSGMTCTNAAGHGFTVARAAQSVF